MKGLGHLPLNKWFEILIHGKLIPSERVMNVKYYMSYLCSYL